MLPNPTALTNLNQKAYSQLSYWIYLFFLGVMQVLAPCHRRILWLFGRSLGWLAYHFAYKPRAIVTQNIALCFPEQSPQWQAQRVREYFQNLCLSVMEWVMVLKWKEADLKPLLHIEGLEYLEQARLSGRGVILLTGHFTCLELALRLVSLTQYRFQVVYRQLKNPWLNDHVYRQRQRSATQLIERKQVRQLIHALKQGAWVFYLPDMDLGKRFESTIVPFFGIPVATTTATSKLAQRCNALVMPVCYQRVPDTQEYHIVIKPPLAQFPSGDINQDTQRINHVLEEMIRMQPGQYFWHQKRFRRSADANYL